MAIANTYANNEYQRSSVLTAGRGKLLLMAYDGALRFLRQAGEAMKNKDTYNQNDYILKAQRIVMELLNTIDHSHNTELAQALDRLYRYIYDRLTEANIKDDLAALEESQVHLKELREAWAEADSKYIEN